jgi:hypothetical protein
MAVDFTGRHVALLGKRVKLEKTGKSVTTIKAHEKAGLIPTILSRSVRKIIESPS